MIAQKKGSTSWTEQEERFLRENYRTHPARVLAEVLGRTRNSVIGRANRLGLSSERGDALRSAYKARFMERKMPKIVPDEPTNDSDYLSRNLIAITAHRGFEDKRKKPVYTYKDKEDPVVSLNGVGVSLWDISSSQCRWVVGDPKNITFCGHGKEAGSSYCLAHTKLSKLSKQEPK